MVTPKCECRICAALRAKQEKDRDRQRQYNNARAWQVTWAILEAHGIPYPLKREG